MKTTFIAATITCAECSYNIRYMYMYMVEVRVGALQLVISRKYWPISHQTRHYLTSTKLVSQSCIAQS